MKKLIPYVLIILLVCMFASCDANHYTSPDLDIEAPIEEYDNLIGSRREWQTDPTGTFSYLLMIPQGNMIPCFEQGYEFPDNMFVYEVLPDSLGGSIMYGYMDNEFTRLSKPINLEPNVFMYGLTRIMTNDGSYIVDTNFDEIPEHSPGYVYYEDAIIEVTWGHRPITNPSILTDIDPDKYLVPYMVTPGTIKGIDIPVYGYKTVNDTFSPAVPIESNFQIPAIFEDARMFRGGIAGVKQNGLWGFIYDDGNVAMDAEYKNIRDFSNGVGAVYTTIQASNSQEIYTYDAWKFVDSEGNYVSDSEFYEVYEFVNDMVFVNDLKGGRYYLHTGGDEPLKKLSVDSFTGDFVDGYALIWSSGYYFMDVNGNFLMNKQYRSARSFSGGLAAVKQNKHSKWGYIDRTGQTVLSADYVAANDFSKGFALVYTDYKKPPGLIDKFGNQYLEGLNLKSISAFNDDGYAIAKAVLNIEKSVYDEASRSYNDEIVPTEVYYMIHIN